MLKASAALFLAAMAASATAPAKIYYVNQGVKYHIGDGHASASEDSLFLDAYPVVGPRWVQAFTVDREDTVRVRIDNIWGVDDCAYCKDMIFIDGHPMARLFEENNHQGFATPSPLSMRVHPGHVYVLSIESEGLPGPIDDFAIEGVAVESDLAEVQMLAPGPVVLQPQQPLPVFSVPPPVVGPCEGTQAAGDWMPPVARSRGMLAWDPTLDPVLWRLGAPLDPGHFARVYVRVEKAGSGGAVDQFFEVLLGDPGTGWVIDFAPGRTTPFMGNVKVEGRYRSDHFQVSDWHDGGWNELQVARCPDGQARFWINGTDVGLPLPTADGSAFRLRSGGLKAEAAEKPY
jgi:hypothetical protein